MLQSQFYPELEQADARQALFRCGVDHWQFDYTQSDGELRLNALDSPVLSFQRLHQMLDMLWSARRPGSLYLAPSLVDALPLVERHWQPADDGGLRVARAAFYQQREIWLSPALWPVAPAVDVAADCPGGRHPLRPALSDGLLYQKYLSATGEWFELRRAEVARDGELFHRWQNQPRVAEFWEEARSRQELDAYLQQQRDDAHSEPLIGYINGVPFAYIQSYWAREDRIGPYYEVEDFDHGFHLLVGDTRFLGRARTLAWLKAASHYLFLLDPRTDRLVGEPRADNERLIRYTADCGWRKLKEFDFPHKRAALLMCERASFFAEQWL